MLIIRKPKEIDPAIVEAAYSGKLGCACGCRGKYSYASAFAKQAGKRRGYDVSPDEISDRSIVVMTRKFNKAIADKNIQVYFDHQIGGEPFYFFETDTRLYMLFLCDTKSNVTVRFQQEIDRLQEIADRELSDHGKTPKWEQLTDEIGQMKLDLAQIE